VLKWIKSLFSGQPEAISQNEVQALRLELAERDRQIAQLKADLERQRLQAEARGAESVQAQLEKLFEEAASAIAQLQTQAHLLEAENRPIQARDVLTIARRLVRVLEDHGLSLRDRVGEQVAFDPNLHEPLAGETPRPGQPAIVRFPGVAFRGRLLRKAGVDPGGEL
jgi:molecular chaperone GrpE (heat shock protein)